jgi:uncharacterized coiled-coil protein SlyX
MNRSELQKLRTRIETLEIKLTVEQDVFEDAAQELARMRKIVGRTRGQLERAQERLFTETTK